MINFPSSLDSLSNPTWTDKQDIIPHSSQHSNANDAIEALEAKVGINGSTDPSSLDYKITQLNPLTTKGDIIVRSATANARLPVGSDGQMLVADSTQTLGVKYTNPTSGGTVTTASVVSANWFTGSVANPTTTPAITLTTSVTGVLKGNGTAISSATQGTDYYAPSGTDVSVADGGTGVSSLTAYAPIFGGTSGTGAVQSGTVGSAGQVLTSNGSGAFATFQSIPWAWNLLQTIPVTWGLASTINTGTLTSYNYYGVVYNFDSSNTSTLIWMQINSYTATTYTTLLNSNASNSIVVWSWWFNLGTPAWSTLFWEFTIVAKWSKKFVIWSWMSLNWSAIMAWEVSETSDASSLQFFRSGSWTITGNILIYWKN